MAQHVGDNQGIKCMYCRHTLLVQLAACIAIHHLGSVHAHAEQAEADRRRVGLPGGVRRWMLRSRPRAWMPRRPIWTSSAWPSRLRRRSPLSTACASSPARRVPVYIAHLYLQKRHLLPFYYTGGATPVYFLLPAQTGPLVYAASSGSCGAGTVDRALVCRWQLCQIRPSSSAWSLPT